MLSTDKITNKESGQTLTLAVVTLMICSNMLLALFQISLTVQEKIHLQISTDLALLSALNTQANGLNSIAFANRAILANDALVGQINALVSEASFYKKLVDKFYRLLRFIPYAGPLSRFLLTSIQMIEKTIRKTASIIFPIAHFSNITLRKGQEGIITLLPIASLQSAKLSLRENMPNSALPLISRTLLLRQARLLKKCIFPTVSKDTASLKAQTMDRHTMKRNWNISAAGISPVKKTGGTAITSKDLEARDKLKIKVFNRLRLRWKTFISTVSNATKYAYATPSDFLSLDSTKNPEAFSVSILGKVKMPSLMDVDCFQKKDLMAISAGKITYRRNSKIKEEPNLFNPFWKAELTAIKTEPSAKHLLPELILKEILH
jgi:hypothetical protein